MRLLAIYSNDDEKFPPIKFHEGLNVIFAKVKDPGKKGKDSHNLGKTFLIQVIDFVLLTTVKASHPFKTSAAAFDPFVFFLDVETNQSKRITIRRPVEVVDRKAVSIHIHDSYESNFKLVTDQVIKQWTYKDLPLQTAKRKLDEILDLSVLNNAYDYRKGLGYVLRRQSDYNEEFRLERFKVGKDKNWKPFTASLLGFTHDILREKYDLDAEITMQLKSAKEAKKEAKSEEYNELKGKILLEEDSINKLTKQIDEFSFKDIEERLSETTVKDIEQQTAKYNIERYKINRELVTIDKSLEAKLTFDIQKIKKVLAETRVALSNELVKGYEELLEFNRKLSQGRLERLKERKSNLLEERGFIEKELSKLDIERRKAMSLLQDEETLNKFRSLQNIVREHQQRLHSLKERLWHLDRAAQFQVKAEAAKEKQVKLIAKIKEEVHNDSDIFSAIRQQFSDFVEAILNVKALLSVNYNDHGNLDFKIKTLDKEDLDKETSEAKGTSYKKLLCAAFDLTILSVYSERSYYRFVYHDGIFEGLDNRKKVNLLELIRSVCSRDGLQYILTVIDADLPRDEKDQKLLFSQVEIVRELHDQGEEGRLFRMPAF